MLSTYRPSFSFEVVEECHFGRFSNLVYECRTQEQLERYLVSNYGIRNLENWYREDEHKYFVERYYGHSSAVIKVKFKK